MKRCLCFLFSILCLIFSVSCSNPQNEITTEPDLTEEMTEAVTVDMSYSDELPADLNFGDETIHILASGQVGAKDELYSEGRNNELINDSVYERNRVVENRLGVLLDVIADGGNDSFYVSQKISNLVTTGTNDFQLCTIPSYVAVQQIVKGEYRNLTTIDNLDLNKKYWAKGYNDMASWGDGYQFMASGSAALTLFRYMYVTLYNKDVLTDRHLDDPIQAVENGAWTLDYQTAMTEGMYADSNGNGQADEQDFYGFVSGSLTSCDCYWISCKTTLLEKDENGYFVYNADVERMSRTVDAVLSLYYRGDSYIYSTSDKDSTYNNNIIEKFGDGQTFMVNTMITKLEVSLLDFKGDYGIVPIPKLDSAQETYRTCVQDQVSAYMIPNTLPSSQYGMMGAVMECIASESYKTVVDAYYNTALSYRYLNNPESKVMLDLIYDCVSFEIGQIYTEAAGNFLGNMRTLITSKKNTVSSMLKTQSKSMERTIKQLNGKYEKVVKSQ